MKKIEVTWCGMQERIGLSPFLLVTEIESRTTVAFDKAKHEIVVEERMVDHAKN